MTLKDADKIKEAIQNSDDFVGGSDDIIKVIDSVPEVVISTDTDTISRKAAIDALDKRFDSIPMEQTTAILSLRRDLRELPSAEPHWTSCKKELPKLDSRCVLLYSDYTISGGYYRGNRTFEVDYGDKDVNTMVIAWMPRPEAWKGEVNDENN